MLERYIDVQKTSGKKFPFKIKINTPEKQADHYLCKIEFEGWIDAPPNGIRGHDGYESVTESMVLIYSILAEFQKRGVRFYRKNSEAQFDLTSFLTPVIQTDETQ